jgi:hypothetical protein
MRRIVWPIVAAVGFHAALLAGYVAAFGGDLGALVCVGGERVGHAPYELIHHGFKQHGYDGQFYYALARAPWQRHLVGIDSAPIRQARILYPAVSWLLSGGEGERLLWVMPLVNLLAIAGLAGLGARLAHHHGLSPWWGVLLPLAVNAGMPALRNLSDIVSTFTVCGLLVCWILRGPGWAMVLWAAAAVFSREQNIVVIGFVLMGSAGRRDWRMCASLIAVLVSWAFWIATLYAMYGTSPFLPAKGNTGLPLAGMLFRWTHLELSESKVSALFHVWSMLLLTVEIGLAVYLIRLRVDPVVTGVALAGAALAVIGGISIYEDRWSYTRVFAWLPLGLWLACVQARWKPALIALALPLLLPVAVVVKVWFAPG